MNAPFTHEQPPEPLKIEHVQPIVMADGVSTRHAITLTLNREPTELELRMYRELPATPIMFADAKRYAERVQLAELVVMLFRTFMLGGIVLPESPKVMDWLKSWIDGVGHGPIGGPLRWPDHLPFAAEMLTGRGFIRTVGEIGYVARRMAGRPEKVG